MIQAYGTSLAGVKEIKQDSDKNKKKEDITKSNFNERVNKRRVIVEILANQGISNQKKKDLQDNREEYIEDPNIFISNDGNVKYITEATERKRMVFEPLPMSKLEIDKKDIYSQSWGSSLSRAKKMKGNQFPIFVVPWDEKKQYFNTNMLDEIEGIKSIISNQDFYPVSAFFKKFLYLKLFCDCCDYLLNLGT